MYYSYETVKQRPATRLVHKLEYKATPYFFNDKIEKKKLFFDKTELCHLVQRFVTASVV
jgi:hypothetical protein